MLFRSMFCIHQVLSTFGAFLIVLFMQIGADLFDECMLMIESLKQAVYTLSDQKVSSVCSCSFNFCRFHVCNL